MESSVLTSVILPLALAIIMLGMGMSLVIDDFKRVFKYPKAAFLGLTNQLVVLPLIGFALVVAFDLPMVMAIGIMLIASCPGGATSNLITHVCKGDIALSISLTAVTSMLTVFTIPVILSFSFGYFSNESNTIELPIIKTIVQIMVITIIPISIGMIIRHYKEKFALNMEKTMRIASTVIFSIVLLGIILANKNSLIPYFKQIGIVALLLNITTMCIGYFSSKLLKLNLKQKISITIESGIQNGTLAIVIATTILEQVDMSIPAAVYSLIMFFTCGFMMWYFGRRKA
ncbi:MAG: bile acid:sodium symporter family protein [Flavobacteriaceae bacterium]|nr:bile acid:sodium symporter family protein [Flavobacteriaceae bacterium]